jgi:hypothetical protein
MWPMCSALPAWRSPPNPGGRQARTQVPQSREPHQTWSGRGPGAGLGHALQRGRLRSETATHSGSAYASESYLNRVKDRATRAMERDLTQDHDLCQRDSENGT